MADYIAIITMLQTKYQAYQPSDIGLPPPVVAVGGSYGGMLAAYLQRQHPNIITVAWASSAPVVGYSSTVVAQNKTGHKNL